MRQCADVITELEAYRDQAKREGRLTAAELAELAIRNMEERRYWLMIDHSPTFPRKAPAA